MNYLQQGDNKWYFATFTSFVWSLLHVILFTISFHEESTRRYHSRALWGSMIGCILSIYSIVKVRASFIVTVAKMSVARRFDDGELHATANGPRVCELLGILLYLLNGASYALWVMVIYYWRTDSNSCSGTVAHCNIVCLSNCNVCSECGA